MDSLETLDVWPTVSIDQVASDVTVGHVGPMKDEYLEIGIPFLRSLSVEPFGIREEGLKFISAEFHQKLKKSALVPGDVVIVRTGKPGTCAVVPGWLGTANCSDLVIVRCGPRVRPHFLCYVVNSVAGDHILSHTVGAVQQHFNVGSARTLKFLLPPIGEQDYILQLLRGLDDRIELNRRMNATLEGMARALFKDWFVDFGPTRAKMALSATKSGTGAKNTQNCEKPYLAPEIWSLFPDRLDDEGVPEGWEEKCIRDIIELSYGKSLPAKKRIAGNIPVYGSGGITGTHNEPLVKEPTIIVGRKGTVGSLYWQPTPCFPIDTVFYVKPKASLVYCYYLLQTLGLDTMNTDAAVPGLNRDNAYRLPVMWASEAVREAFDNLVTPLRERMDANQQESRTLAQTRDLLLPKLMSGEIRVREAEQIAEAAQ